MELDPKQRVLLAIYTEYQKDLPQMENISAQLLGLDLQVFGIAIEKLDNEGLIRLPNDALRKGGMGGNIQAVFTRGLMMKPLGIEYVEHKLAIEKTLSGKEKVQKVSESAVKWGWGQIKDIGAKVLAEMAAKAAGV